MAKRSNPLDRFARDLRPGRLEWIGDVLLEASAICHPCSRMEEALGEGGVAAMLGHGGLCCRILGDGVVAVGDAVRVEAPGESLDLLQ